MVGNYMYLLLNSARATFTIAGLRMAESCDASRQGAGGPALRQISESDLARFRAIRSKYLLY